MGSGSLEYVADRADDRVLPPRHLDTPTSPQGRV